MRRLLGPLPRHMIRRAHPHARAYFDVNGNVLFASPSLCSSLIAVCENVCMHALGRALVRSRACSDADVCDAAAVAGACGAAGVDAAALRSDTAAAVAAGRGAAAGTAGPRPPHAAVRSRRPHFRPRRPPPSLLQPAAAPSPPTRSAAPALPLLTRPLSLSLVLPLVFVLAPRFQLSVSLPFAFAFSLPFPLSGAYTPTLTTNRPAGFLRRPTPAPLTAISVAYPRSLCACTIALCCSCCL